MRREFITFLALAFLLTSKMGSAQNLTVTFTDIEKTKSYKISAIRCNDTLSIQKNLNSCLLPLYRKGFLAASIDSFSCDSFKLIAFGKMGGQYRWAKLLPDSATNILQSDAGIRFLNFSGKPVNPKLLIKSINSTLKQLEDNGFPLASVKLNQVSVGKNTISATVNIDKGSRIVIDTIFIKGDARVVPKQLAALISLRKGEPYSESKIKRIDQKLKGQAYLNFIKPSEVEFLNHTARVYCYLTNRDASRFWGLAGFYSDKTDGKIKLNGDINLSLVNSLKYGEKINFTWSAPGKGTQNLNINTDWPFVFGWQVGVISSLSLYRHDSTYITFNPKLSFSFFTSNGGRFLLNLDYKKTTYTSSSPVVQTQYGNSSTLLYGFGYEFNSYDNVTLPTRGIVIKSNVNTGSRNLTQRQSPTSSLFDGELFAESFIPLYENRFILALRSNSRIIAIYSTKGSTTLFENEMHRVGGMETIRGFNQESIISAAYSIASSELHLRMSEGSGIYLFADKAYVKAYELGDAEDRWPLGVGVGLNMVTKAGLFNLSYALGQGFGQNLRLRDAMVHFGIATVF